jgi:cytochrome b
MMDMGALLVVAMVAMMILMMGGMLLGRWRTWFGRRRKRDHRTE